METATTVAANSGHVNTIEVVHNMGHRDLIRYGTRSRVIVLQHSPRFRSYVANPGTGLKRISEACDIVRSDKNAVITDGYQKPAGERQRARC